MRRRRHGQPDLNLTNGPGKLCIALGIDRGFDRADLLEDRVWIEEGKNIPARQIASGPRIGIDYAEEWIDKPWRFWIKGNPFVSRKGCNRKGSTIVTKVVTGVGWEIGRSLEVEI